MIPYLNRILGGLLIVAIGFGIVQSVRLDRAQDFHKDFVAEIKDEMIQTYKDLTVERNKAELTTAKIGNAYNQGVRDADTLSQVTIARLNNDLAGVQKHWRSALRRADAAEAALTGSELDAAAAAVSADLAGFVRGAAAGDAKIVSLQDTVNSHLCQINKEPFPGFKCPKL